MPSSGVLIIGLGGQLYEVDYGQGSASGKITTLDLSDPDNFFNNLSLIKSQVKTVVRNALIVSLFDSHPINMRHPGTNFREYQPYKDTNYYYSPFGEFSDHKPVYLYKPGTYNVNVKKVRVVQRLNDPY